MRLIPYRLPLRRPLPIPGLPPPQWREGFLLYDAERNRWGEASPLPGFSRESAADVEAAFRRGLPEAACPPSLRFAFDCLRRPWPPQASGPVRINALWSPEAESLPDFCARIRDWSAPCIKVKPAYPPDPAPLLALLQARPDARLRLDGNRRWTLAHCLQVAEALPAAQVEYFEEPLAELDDYAALWRRAPVPVALDESLRQPEGWALAESPGVKALILKPSLTGGEADWQPWQNAARDRGCSLIWSSSFESGVGLWHLAALAAGGAPAGLDTGGIFTDDVTAPRPLPEQGRLRLPAALRVQLPEGAGGGRLFL